MIEMKQLAELYWANFNFTLLAFYHQLTEHLHSLTDMESDFGNTGYSV